MTATLDDDLSADAICRSPIATVVTNPRAPDNPIVAVNAAFERLTGYAAREVIGRNCRFLAGPEPDAGTPILREAIRECRPALATVRNYKRDGTPFLNAVMIAPLFDADGALRYFVGSQTEVTGGGGPAADSSRQLVAGLTPRQKQVLLAMTLGYRNKQIAAQLRLSEKTVKMHRKQMLLRLGAISSSEAVRIAVEAGL